MNNTCFCGISEHCGYQIETDMEQHDKVVYEQGYHKAVEDFMEKLLEIAPKNYAGALELGGRANYLSAYHVKKIAKQLKP